jgi:hypothetical protein
MAPSWNPHPTTIVPYHSNLAKCNWCHKISDEDRMFSCEYCNENCCASCICNCPECHRVVCRRCMGKKLRNICVWCEYEKTDNDYLEEHKLDIDVFLMIDGQEFHVSNTNGNAAILVDSTDPLSDRHKRYLDIKGIGVLIYRYRTIHRKSLTMVYHLHCDQWRG